MLGQSDVKDFPSFMAYLSQCLEEEKYTEELTKYTLHWVNEFFKYVEDFQHYPNIGFDGTYLLFEWWKDPRKITLYLEETPMALLIRGPHMINDMDDVLAPIPEDFATIWKNFLYPLYPELTVQ